ncbi:MAG: tetratricopeptide repeat protein [Acidobacteriota bacterium]
MRRAWAKTPQLALLKRERVRQKIRQADAAAALGVTERHYRRIENGETRPERELLGRLLSWAWSDLDIPESELLPSSPTLTGLPVPASSFVGRQQELAELARRLAGGGRLVTVLGPAGVGKTRLVLQYAATSIEGWPGGVWFCDLSEARTLNQLHQAVASGLGLLLSGKPGAQIGHALAGRGCCLVVLDNFEQLACHAEQTIARWLGLATDARMLVTSRELLGVPGEVVTNVGPLPVDSDGVALFEERARSRCHDFAVTDGNRPAVLEAVSLLDGLPLAIELAAARLAVLTPRQLVERLSERFRLLGSVGRNADRRASLGAAIAWSWDLLEAWEQAALAQLSVFEGSFSLEAAEAVLDLERYPSAPWCLDVVQSLVHKSLLRVWLPQGAGIRTADSRLGMFLSIREFSAEKLRGGPAGSRHGLSSDAAERACLRHGEHFGLHGVDDSIDKLYESGGEERREMLAMDVDNLHVACERALERGDTLNASATLFALWVALSNTGPFSLIESLASRVCETAVDGTLPQAKALYVLAHARAALTGPVEAIDLFEEVARDCRSLGELRWEAEALGEGGFQMLQAGRLDEARARILRSLELARAEGRRRLEGHFLGYLGLHGFVAGELSEARECFESALEIHREVENESAVGFELGNLGLVKHASAELAEARDCYLRSMAIGGEGYRYMVTLGNLALLNQDEGNTEEARRLFSEALSLNRRVGYRASEGLLLGNLGLLDFGAGELESAVTNSELAIEIAREVGNKRSEGSALCTLGQVARQQGRQDEAAALFASGELVLREAEDPVELGKLLAQRVDFEASRGHLDEARRCHAELEQIGDKVGAEVDSGLGRALQLARGVLGDST